MTRPRRGRAPSLELSELQWSFLNDALPHDYPSSVETLALSHDDGLLDFPGARTLWEQFGDVVLDHWIPEKPGTRPSLWWRLSAPRSLLGTWPGRWFDGTLPEPRRRLGGIGTPAYEALAYVPQFDHGLPVSWVSPDEVEYYSGRARDIHGNAIGTEYAEGHFPHAAIDPADPPTFESEAAYLERHGLLRPGERKRLTAVNFAPEALRI